MFCLPKTAWPSDLNDGGRALNGLGVLPDYQTQSNFECRHVDRGSETAGDKFRSREGKSPDRQLRSPNGC